MNASITHKQVKTLIGLIIFTEGLFFIALIVGYIYYKAANNNWADSENYLDISKTALFTIFLFLSSATIILSEKQKKKENRTGELIFLVMTIALGTIFIIGQAMEYSRLFQMRLYPATNIFGSAFFTLTGFHALHVIIGLICLLIILGLSLNSKTYSQTQVAFYPVSLYWHFVDVVWAFVFTVTYILPYIS